MEKFEHEKSKDKADHLPQSEAEWLKTGKFEVENIAIGGKEIRCALVRGPENSPLVTMVGGIPRDHERRKKLPLINKLYGHLALKILDQAESSLLYNQPAHCYLYFQAFQKLDIQLRNKALEALLFLFLS